MSVRAPAYRNQYIIFPELLAEKIENVPHAARFFLYLAGEFKLRLYKRFYLGTPPYSRPILVAVILYAMYNGYYGYESIKQYVDDSLGAQWILNGMKMPSYKTIERTIKSILDELEEIFGQVLALCEQQGLIGGECAYIDGVKVQANASKHKAMSYEYLNKKIKRGEDSRRPHSHITYITGKKRKKNGGCRFLSARLFYSPWSVSVAALLSVASRSMSKYFAVVLTYL